MKLEVKKIDPVRRELRFEVPKERVSQKLEEVFSEYSKIAKVKGFRPGKAPRHVIESEYGRQAHQELIKQIIPEVYQEALKQENLSPVDLPEIEDVSLKDGVVRFTAKLDIRPEVNVKDYRGIHVSRKSSQVTDEEINKTLEYIQKGQGKDGPVELNDAFARGLGYPNLEEFKNSLRRQLEIDKDRHSRLDIENQIVAELLKKTQLAIPQSLVHKQLERRVHEAVEHQKSHGIPEEEIKKREEVMRKELRDSVEKDIRVFFILEKIAELEKIEIKENENLPAKVMEFLLKEAKWEGTK